MKKIKIGESFKNKKFKYGGYATLLTSVFLVILLVLNVVVGKLDVKFDMTKNKLFSLSTASNKIVGNLKQDVTIYALYPAGQEDTRVSEVLEKYNLKNKKVAIVYKDPLKYPAFTQQYTATGTTISQGSLIVVSGSKYKVIDSTELFGNDGTSTTATSSAVEQKVTGAITYVSSAKSAVVDNLTGHEETALPTEITTQLTNQNYTVKDTSLAAKDSSVDKSSLLLVVGPKKDLTTDELAKIKDFLSKGGKALFLMDFSTTTMPNFTELFSYLGIKPENDFILEGNAGYVVNNYQNMLLPEMQDHLILSPLITAKTPVIVPNAQSIATLKVKRNTLTIEPLLITSGSAYGKINLNPTTSNQEKGDIGGPLILAMAITDKAADGNTDNDGRSVIIGSSTIANSQIIAQSNGANTDLVMNSINWAVGNRDNITLTPKDMTAQNLTINEQQILTASAFTVLVIPLTVVIIGVVVWIRRRHL